MAPTFCYEAPEDPNCLPQGELNEVDHYFVSLNECKSIVKDNLADQISYELEFVQYFTNVRLSD